MALVSLDLARGHCRVDPGVEDELIGLYLAAAEQAALDYLSRQVFESVEALDAAVQAGTARPYAMVVNAAIKAAILKTTSDLYANREDSVVGANAVELPLTARSLLRPHRIVPGV